MITDFKQAGDADKIDMAGIDAGVLSFQAPPTTTAIAHSVNWYDAGGDTIVQADVNGNTTADFTLVLLGSIMVLTASDFIL
jgi:hypothetical protein